MAVSGAGPLGPKVISAAFADTVSGAEKQRFFDRHFQYFRAFAHPQNYDYFAITAGAMPLSQRYAARRDSPPESTLSGTRSGMPGFSTLLLNPLRMAWPGS